MSGTFGDLAALTDLAHVFLSLVAGCSQESRPKDRPRKRDAEERGPQQIQPEPAGLQAWRKELETPPAGRPREILCESVWLSRVKILRCFCRTLKRVPLVCCFRDWYFAACYILFCVFFFSFSLFLSVFLFFFFSCTVLYFGVCEVRRSLLKILNDVYRRRHGKNVSLKPRRRGLEIQ